ncbi:MAG TPA: MFS transporter [Burkholderiaceae bacterium]|nr:MFS transporter [Burkholderiaceae bacterium]
MRLDPQPVVSERDLEFAKHCLVRDAGWSSVCGALFGGVVLVGYAIEVGAGPLEIGLLAAIPYLVQVLQIPATVIVERYRRRKRLSVVLLTIARFIIVALALLPVWAVGAATVPLLLAGKFVISALSSVAGCALNSWLHQLLAGQPLGSFFSRRLVAGTVLGCLFTLAAGWVVEHPPLDDMNLGFAIAFAASGIAGLISVRYLVRCPEPLMMPAGPAVSMAAKLAAPFRDREFRPLLVTLGAWNFASNFAAPFLTVYLIQQLDYRMGTVTQLWVLNQLANALTLYAWGRVSDRLSNKAILSVALPVFFLCTVALALARAGAPLGLQLALLAAVHVVMGVVGGGIGLAMGNLGLKLAPAGQGTAYLAAVGLVSSAAGGLAPLVAGSLGEWLESSRLELLLRWSSASALHELSVLRFAHFEFLFAIAGLLGLYVMHALSRIREGNHISERRVVQELLLEAQRTVDQLSSIGSLLSSLFSFDRLSERRAWFRQRPSEEGDRTGRP